MKNLWKWAVFLLWMFIGVWIFLRAEIPDVSQDGGFVGELLLAVVWGGVMIFLLNPHWFGALTESFHDDFDDW